jgi:uncharacterized phiE125 gp8 family phage protein
MSYLKLVTAPASYPIDLTDLKLHLGITGSDNDTHLTAILAASTAYVEKELNRSLVSQTWDWFLPYFPQNNIIELPKPPLVSVTYLKYYDENNAQQTWSSNNYVVHTPTTLKGYVEIKNTSTLPNIYPRSDSILIRFVSGYGTQNDMVKHAVRLVAAHWFENREAETTGSTKQIEIGLQRILNLMDTGLYA